MDSRYIQLNVSLFKTMITAIFVFFIAWKISFSFYYYGAQTDYKHAKKSTPTSLTILIADSR